MNILNHLRRSLLTGLAIAAAWGATAHADDYPSRKIRILMPLAAGSAADVVVRIVAEKMGAILGQQMYIDNEPGASGLIATRTGMRAAPDGYTILAPNDTVLTTLPNMREDAGYDPRKDLAPITLLARFKWTLVATTSFAPKTLQEFIAAAKAKPGSINFGSGGVGSPQHLAMIEFEQAAGIQLTHVAYKGTTAALNDVVAGHIPVMFTALPTPLPFLPDKLRVYGVAEKTRDPILPNVPTLDEGGVKGFEFYTWGCLMAPLKTPAPIIAKLNGAAVQALKDPAVAKRLTDLGYEIVGNTPEQMHQFLVEDYARMGDVIRKADLHVK